MLSLKGFDSDNFKSAGDFDFVIRLYLSGAQGVDCKYNFVSFRIGGFSNTDTDLSCKECIKSLNKNFGSLLRKNKECNFERMFYKYYVPDFLFKNILYLMCNHQKKIMAGYWISKNYAFDRYKRIDYFSKPEINEHKKQFLNKELMRSLLSNKIQTLKIRLSMKIPFIYFPVKKIYYAIISFINPRG